MTDWLIVAVPWATFLAVLTVVLLRERKHHG